jgi:serine/threonine protein kinase
MLIADFGLSKVSKEESLTTSDSINDKGMPAFIDPQCHKNGYKRDKKSDIFSFGMILWEISSEKAPFANDGTFQIVFKYSEGIREKRVDGTPEPYFELYTKCWDNEPASRPNIDEVVEVLNNYIFSCETLTIGDFPVFSTNPLCYYSFTQKLFTLHVSRENAQLKMEFPLHNVFSIEYCPIDDVYSQVAIEVKGLPFLDDMQASRHTRYVLKGRADLMKPRLNELMQDDQNIANVVTMVDTPAPADPLSPKIILMLLYELILQLLFLLYSRRSLRILRFKELNVSRSCI